MSLLRHADEDVNLVPRRCTVAAYCSSEEDGSNVENIFHLKDIPRQDIEHTRNIALLQERTKQKFVRVKQSLVE